MSATSGGSQIKTGDELFGITYWAQWWMAPRTPRYEVFRYFGWAQDTGLYYFYHRKNPTIFITKNFNQLAADPSFKPFLIDTAKLGVEYVVPANNRT